MKKIFYVSVLSALLLAACGGSTEENLGGTTNTDDNIETNTEQATEESQETSNDINQVIVDNEHIKATLVKIVKKNDDMWGNQYEVIFDVENKRQDKIEVQARSISADGRMIEDVLTLSLIHI